MNIKVIDILLKILLKIVLKIKKNFTKYKEKVILILICNVYI